MCNSDPPSIKLGAANVLEAVGCSVSGHLLCYMLDRPVTKLVLVVCTNVGSDLPSIKLGAANVLQTVDYSVSGHPLCYMLAPPCDKAGSCGSHKCRLRLVSNCAPLRRLKLWITPCLDTDSAACLLCPVKLLLVCRL
jgi:hypothetical protein